MKIFLPCVVMVCAIAGCAATYKAPTSLNVGADERVPGQRADLFKASQRALVLGGYQIMNTDEKAGTISTAARDLRLTPEQADCGTTMGIDYLKDNRTSTKVSFGLLVDDGRINIRTTVQGEYKPGDVNQNITLTCVSRGLLENQLMVQIRREL